MARILIAEDSPTQAIQIQLMLEAAEYEAEIAADGVQALQQIEANPPDVVLTDLHMPNMNGLELVEKIRQQYESIPVILITADGTESIAAEALQKGAASYIPKRFMDKSLLPTLRGVVEMLQAQRTKQRVLSTLVESRSRFVLKNDPQLAASLVQHLEDELEKLNYSDQTGLFRISLALTEALANAMDHGNLELNSDLRDDPAAYAQLRQARCQQDPYRCRRVTLIADLSPTAVSITVRDEGPGFDPSTIPDPTDPENLVRASGRGLMLIQSFMDEVRHNATGNEITMIKYCESLKGDGAPTACDDPAGCGGDPVACDDA